SCGFGDSEMSLQPDVRHPPRGVAASGLRPLCNIPHCCLPYESGLYLSPNLSVHPLRPDTRRRLGRPLPHQQADRPQAHPTPQKLSTTPSKMRSYMVLDTVSQAYPTVQGRSPTCYSPVRHSSTPSKLEAFPFDLHVLSTPPAFILSQDQTLHKRREKPKPNKKDKQHHDVSATVKLTKNYYIKKSTNPTTKKWPSKVKSVYLRITKDNNYIDINMHR